MTAGNVPETAGDPVPYLETLAARLRAEGWHVRVGESADGTPYARVINPATIVLNDAITAVRHDARPWWYVWSWGAPIAPIGDLDAVTACVDRVLGDRR